MAIFGSYKSVDYTATGTAGQSTSNLGFENGPLQKWLTQPNTPADAGYESKFDFGTDILTTLYPGVVFGGWQTIETTMNVYNFPRAKRMTPESGDIRLNYTLTEPNKLEARMGAFDNIYLDNILNIGKVYQKFELASTGANYIGFELKEAMEGLARQYENQTVLDLINGGSDGSSFVATGDIYKTILNLRKQLVINGSAIDNVDLYVTPDILNLIMEDSHFISDGQAPVAAEEVRNGFMGRILGFNVIESGRLIGIPKPTGKDANIIAVDVTQVILVRNLVEGVVLKDLPAPYINCVQLSALEYFKHYVVNKNGVYYINMA